MCLLKHNLKLIKSYRITDERIKNLKCLIIFYIYINNMKKNLISWDSMMEEMKEKNPKRYKLIMKETQRLINRPHIIALMENARWESDLSQSELSRKLNLKQSYISRIEKGDCDIRISTVIKYLDALGYELNIIKQYKKNK